MAREKWEVGNWRIDTADSSYGDLPTIETKVLVGGNALLEKEHIFIFDREEGQLVYDMLSGDSVTGVKSAKVYYPILWWTRENIMGEFARILGKLNWRGTWEEAIEASRQLCKRLQWSM